ncbi:MAG: hypothetical protein V1835_04940 [Candidatus Micrarchaeota archaeon]
MPTGKRIECGAPLVKEYKYMGRVENDPTHLICRERDGVKETITVQFFKEQRGIYGASILGGAKVNPEAIHALGKLLGMKHIGNLRFEHPEHAGEKARAQTSYTGPMPRHIERAALVRILIDAGFKEMQNGRLWVKGEYKIPMARAPKIDDSRTIKAVFAHYNPTMTKIKFKA